jgi:hypothetical protein
MLRTRYKLSATILRVATVVLLVLTGAPSLSAQLKPLFPERMVPRGARIRVVARSFGEASTASAITTGRVDSVDADGTFHVRRNDGVLLALPLYELARVEVLKRRESTLDANMTAFGAFGALAGTALYVKWCGGHPEPCRRDLTYRHDDDDDWDDDDDDDSSFSVLTFSVLGGALLGSAIGYAVTPKRWQPIVIPFRTGRAGEERGAGIRLGANVQVR